MAIKAILLAIVAAVVLLAVPIAMIWGVVDHVKNGRKRERRGGSAGAGFGPVLMDLDRLTRPSVEHVIEAQTPVLRREDDGGEGDPPKTPPLAPGH